MRYGSCMPSRIRTTKISTSARVDWLQSAKNSIYGRFFVTDYDNPVFYTNNILTTTRSGLEERATSAVIADQYSKAGFVNAFHGTYTA